MLLRCFVCGAVWLGSRSRRRLRRLVYVRGALHLTNKRLRGILNFAHDSAGLAHDGGQFLLAEDQQRKNSEDGHVGNGEHDAHFSPAGGAAF